MYKKQRQHFANKGLYSQSYGFSSSQVGCENWTIKKAEHQRITAFKLWCWRRLLRVPWTTKEIKPVNPKGNQPWIFIGKNWCWSWSSNTFATWSKEPILWKRPWCWERLKSGREGDDRGWGGWMASLIQWIWILANSGRQGRTGKAGVLQFTGSQRVGHDWVTEQQQNGYHFTFIHQIYQSRHGAGATEVRRHGLCPEKIQSTVGNTVAWKGMEFAWRLYSWWRCGV